MYLISRCSLLRASYAIHSTDIGYVATRSAALVLAATQEEVPSYALSYAMSAYLPTRSRRDAGTDIAVICAISLRECYAMSGSDRRMVRPPAGGGGGNVAPVGAQLLARSGATIHSSA
eukprot:3935277-Rhodomonas_salina.1